MPWEQATHHHHNPHRSISHIHALRLSQMDGRSRPTCSGFALYSCANDHKAGQTVSKLIRLKGVQVSCLGTLCITSAMRVRVQNGMAGVPAWRAVCRAAHASQQVRQTPVLGRTLAGRGFAGDALRCEFRQAVQACLGFRASRLFPQKPRRARRRLCRVSLGGEQSGMSCNYLPLIFTIQCPNSRKTKITPNTVSSIYPG